MKLMIGMILMATAALAADCLTVEKVYVMPGPGRVFQFTGSGADLAAKLSPRFVIVGRNSCADKRTGQGLLSVSTVHVALYDSEGFRSGVISILVAPLRPGEKFRAVREIPREARALYPVWRAEVLSVEDIAK